jgi:uncharacterized protein (DUF2141 family)
LALASFATISLAASPAPVQNSVEVQLSGLRSTKGFVLLCLTGNAKAFPDCSKDPKAVRAKVAANQLANGMHFNLDAPGGYAVSVIHDENGNGKLDTAMMIPREGFGFSRNPAISFGPPKFAAAAFQVNGEVKQIIKMKYML